jgi:predicted peptidase
MKSTEFALVTDLLLVVVMVLGACSSTTATTQVASTLEPSAVSEATAEVTAEATAEATAAGPGGNMGSSTETESHYPEPVTLFEQYEYTDPETGSTIPYNLYLPEGYDESESYPLLIFVGDASVNSDTVTDPLKQDGAAVWATEEEQAKHKTIVLVPQYTNTLINSIGALVEDGYQWSEGLTLVSNLIFHVVEEYSVDENRIYGTGQSQGCMTTIAISDKYPDFYAAQLLVAGQWNTEEMSAMVDDHLWIVVCEGDTKAYPGMNEAVANWESLGACVATSDMWDSTSSAEGFDSLVADMLSQNCNINYTVFEGGDHMYTWTVAYTIEGIRDWLFEQTK